MTDNQFTFDEAKAVVRYYCGQFNEEHGDEPLVQLGANLKQLTLKLSYYLGAPVPETYLLDVIGVLLDLVDLDNGDHEDLSREGSATIDHGGAIRERIERQIHEELYFAVTAAGIDAPRVAA